MNLPVIDEEEGVSPTEGSPERFLRREMVKAEFSYLEPRKIVEA